MNDDFQLVVTKKPTDQHDIRNTNVYEMSRSRRRITRAERSFRITAMANPKCVPMLAHYTSAPKPVALSFFDVPPASNPSFVGRSDALAIMDKVLTPRDMSENNWGKPRHSCVTICGMGGIGKTEIALQYAHTRKSMFRAVFWIYAGSEIRLGLSFSRIALNLGLLSDHEAGDVMACQHVVLKWLSSTSEPWLLIFDNADEPKILYGHLPVPSNGAIIVTSRSSLAPPIFFESVEIDLQPLSPEEADALLCQVTRRKPYPNEFEERQMLLDRLGNFPLAIPHMGGIILRAKIPFQVFTKIFDNVKSRSNLLRDTGLLSLFEDSHTNLLPDSLMLLQIISFWHPDLISESIFDHQHVSHAADDVFGSTDVYCEAKKALLRYSLILQQKAVKQISVHRLVQEVVRWQMQNEELANAFGAAISFLERALPTHIDQFDPLSSSVGEAEDLISHVLSMKTFYDDMNLQLAAPAKQHLASLLHRVGWYVITPPEIVDFTDHIQGVHQPWKLPDSVLRFDYCVEYMQTQRFLAH